MMNKIFIHKVTEEDINTLISISKTTFDNTFRPDNKDEVIDHYLENAFTAEKMKAQLNNPNSEFFFAYLDNDVAGYIKINRKDAQTEAMGEDTLEIERIYVDHRHQKQGIGKHLYNKAIERAKEHNIKKVWLGVWEHNHNALAFYDKMGFKHTDSHVFQMGDEAQTDFVMTLELT